MLSDIATDGALSHSTIQLNPTVKHNKFEFSIKLTNSSKLAIFCNFVDSPALMKIYVSIPCRIDFHQASFLSVFLSIKHHAIRNSMGTPTNPG